MELTPQQTCNNGTMYCQITLFSTTCGGPSMVEQSEQVRKADRVIGKMQSLDKILIEDTGTTPEDGNDVQQQLQ